MKVKFYAGTDRFVFDMRATPEEDKTTVSENSLYYKLKKQYRLKGIDEIEVHVMDDILHLDKNLNPLTMLQIRFLSSKLDLLPCEPYLAFVETGDLFETLWSLLRLAQDQAIDKANAKQGNQS